MGFVDIFVENIMKDVVIKISGLGKKYSLPIGNKRDFWALKNLNLEIKKGEKVGLMGDNGAGKTTLLKLIAGLTVPNKGKLNAKGKIASLINLEAGFNLELTGRENIILNGMIYGMTKPEVKSKMEQIINFADIGEFIDAPFFTYSSGMRFRLALSVALAAEPDIILLDEIFLSGDVDFQIKTLKKIEEMVKNKKVTLLMASHHPVFVRKYCERFLFLRKGKLIDNGKEIITELNNKWNDYIFDATGVGTDYIRKKHNK